MKKKGLLTLLIVLVFLMLIVIGGLIYLRLYSAPEKIFKTSISNVFEVIKERQKDYTTAKSRIEVSANIESNKEELKEVKKSLESSKLIANIEVDLKDLFINEELSVEYNNDSLLNANLLIQNNKMYVRLKDWFEKYIEISDDEMDFSELQESLDKTTTMNRTQLLDSVEKELLNVLEKQEYTKENVMINYGGKDINVTKSNLKLDEKQMESLGRELLANLKNNTEFQASLGSSKDEIINGIQEILNEQTSNDLKINQNTITISIYTKGLLNEFVGFDIIVDETNEKSCMTYIEIDVNKFEFSMYSENNEEREYIIKIAGETNGNEGNIVITLPEDNKNSDIICKYKKNNNQINYDIQTEIDGTKLVISGSAEVEDLKYSGNAIASMTFPEQGTVSLNYLYNIEYNTNIEKVDVSNVTSMNKMTDEEMQELTTKFEESNLYKLIKSFPLFSYLDEMNINGQQNDEKSVALDKYKVKYNVPENLQYIKYSTENYKSYSDKENSIVYIWIVNENADLYLKDLENDFTFTSSLYSNQEITKVAEYTMGDKTFKYRGITYNYYTEPCSKIFFTYKLDENHTYVVEAEVLNNSITLSQLNSFLDIEVENNIHSSTIDDIIANGQAMSMEEYVKSQLN